MKELCYQIILHSPMGPKAGHLLITCHRHTFSGKLYLLNHAVTILTGKIKNGLFAFDSIIPSPVGAINCHISGEIFEGSLSGIADTSKGLMRFTGQITDTTVLPGYELELEQPHI